MDVVPPGSIALTADNGNFGGSDGHIDTVSVIVLEEPPPRVIDRVVVSDAPEGLAIAPRVIWPPSCSCLGATRREIPGTTTAKAAWSSSRSRAKK